MDFAKVGWAKIIKLIYWKMMRPYLAVKVKETTNKLDDGGLEVLDEIMKP